MSQEAMLEVVAIPEETNKLGNFTIQDVKAGETYWAELYKAFDKNETTTYVAKVIDLSKMDASSASHLKKDTFKIIPYLVKNPIPGIVLTYGIFLVKETKLVIIEEFMVKTLESVIRSEGVLNEAKARFVARSVGEAVNALHFIGAAHQNISPFNIWKDKEGNFKLAGMEYATAFWDAAANESRKHKVSRESKPGKFIAPEIASGSEYDPTKADAYSLAILICYMLLGKYPYESTRSKSFDDQWKDAFEQLEPLLVDSGKDLLKSLLKMDPKERLSIKDALAHPWFTHV